MVWYMCRSRNTPYHAHQNSGGAGPWGRPCGSFLRFAPRRRLMRVGRAAPSMHSLDTRARGARHGDEYRAEAHGNMLVCAAVRPPALPAHQPSTQAMLCVRPTSTPLTGVLARHDVAMTSRACMRTALEGARGISVCFDFRIQQLPAESLSSDESSEHFMSSGHMTRDTYMNELHLEEYLLGMSPLSPVDTPPMSPEDHGLSSCCRSWCLLALLPGSSCIWYLCRAFSWFLCRPLSWFLCRAFSWFLCWSVWHAACDVGSWCRFGVAAPRAP